MLVPIASTFVDLSDRELQSIQTLSIQDEDFILGTETLPYITNPHIPIAQATLSIKRSTDSKFGFQLILTTCGSYPTCIRPKSSPAKKRLIHMGETTSLEHGDTLELLEGKYAFTVIFENPLTSNTLSFPEEISNSISKLPKLTEESIKLFSNVTKVSAAKELLQKRNKIYSVLKDNKLFTYFGDYRVIIVLEGHNKFSTECSCQEMDLEPWCPHIIAALLHCSQKSESVLTESAVKAEIRKLGPVQLEEAVINMAHKNAELVLGEIDSIEKPTGVVIATKETVKEKKSIKDLIAEKIASIRRLCARESIFYDSDSDDEEDLFLGDFATESLKCVDLITTLIQRFDFMSVLQFLLQFEVLASESSLFRMHPHLLIQLANAWALFILMATCPYSPVPFDDSHLTSIRRILEESEGNYLYKDPLEALDNQWNNNVMRLITEKNPQRVSPSSTTLHLNAIRLNILVFLGKREEALQMAENINMTHTVTQLLLLQNKPEEAVRIAMEKGGLSQAQVMNLASFMSYDYVGSFLIGLKALDVNNGFDDKGSVLTMVLSSLYKEKIEYIENGLLKITSELIPEESFSKINKVKPLMVLAEEKVASELITNEFDVQREILDSISYYPDLQREVMSWMLVKSRGASVLAGFFLRRKEFYKAYEVMPAEDYMWQRYPSEISMTHIPSPYHRIAAYLGPAYFQKYLRKGYGNRCNLEEVFEEAQYFEKLGFRANAVVMMAKIFNYTTGNSILPKYTHWMLSNLDREEVGLELSNEILDLWALCMGESRLDPNLLKELESFVAKDPYLAKYFVKVLIWNIPHSKDSQQLLVQVISTAEKYNVDPKEFTRDLAASITETPYSGDSKKEIRALAAPIIYQNAKTLVGAANLAYYIAGSLVTAARDFGLTQWCLNIIDKIDQNELTEEASAHLAKLINSEVAFNFANKMKQGNKPLLQYYFLLTVLRGHPQNIINELLVLAKKLNKEEDLLIKLEADAVNIVDLDRIIYPLMSAGKDTCALNLALASFSRGKHSGDIPSIILELAQRQGKIPEIVKKIQKSYIAIPKEGIDMAISLEKDGFREEALTIYLVAAKNATFTSSQATLEEIFVLADSLGKLKETEEKMLENTVNEETLYDLAKLFANKNDYETAFNFEAKRISISQTDMPNHLDFIVKLSQELPKDVQKSKLTELSNNLRKSKDLVYLAKKIIPIDSDLGVKLAAPIVDLYGVVDNEDILWYCQQVVEHIPNPYKFLKDSVTHNVETMMTVAQFIYEYDKDVAIELAKKAGSYISGVDKPKHILWIIKSASYQTTVEWFSLMDSLVYKLNDAQSIAEIAKFVAEKGHPDKAFKLYTMVIHQERNLKSGSSLDNLKALYTLAFANNFTDLPNMSELYYYLTGVVDMTRLLEFATWLVEQNKPKIAIDIVKYAAEDRPDSVLWDWVLQYGKSIGDSKLMLEARTELIKLTPTLQMWNEIKESEKTEEWENTKKRLLQVINKTTAEVVDIYLAEGLLSELLTDLKSLKGLRLDLCIDKVENIIMKVAKDDTLRTESSIDAIKEVLTNYVWRTWEPSGTFSAKVDAKVTILLGIVKAWTNLGNLEDIHKQLSPMRALVVIAKPQAYASLVKKLEELFPLFQKENRIAEFIHEFSQIKLSQKNRPKCMALLKSFEQKYLS